MLKHVCCLQMSFLHPVPRPYSSLVVKRICWVFWPKTFILFFTILIFICFHFFAFFTIFHKFLFQFFPFFFARSFVSWLQFLGEGIHPWEKTVSVGTGHQWAMAVIWLLGDKGLGDSHSKIDVWDLTILSKCIALNWISTLIYNVLPIEKAWKTHNPLDMFLEAFSG